MVLRGSSGKVIDESKHIVPHKECAFIVIIKMTSSNAKMLLKGTNKVLHGSWRIGTNAPRILIFCIIRGAEIIGALRNDAFFPFNSSLPSGAVDIS